MQEVSKGGRTVLFVSHNMASISRLCSQGLLLQSGQKLSFGGIREIIAAYNETSFNATSEKTWLNSADAPGDHSARLRAVRLRTQADAELNGSIDIAENFIVEIEYELLKTDGNRAPIAAIHLVNENGVVLFASADFNRACMDGNLSPRGTHVSRCCIPGGLLAEGRFSVLAAMVSYNPNIVHAIAPDAVSFQAIELSKHGVRGDCAQDWPGIIRPQLKWS